MYSERTAVAPIASYRRGRSCALVVVLLLPRIPCIHDILELEPPCQYEFPSVILTAHCVPFCNSIARMHQLLVCIKRVVTRSTESYLRSLYIERAP